MRIVEVELMLVAAEAAVLVPIDRQVVVNAGADGLPIAPFDQRRRQGPRRCVKVGVALGIAPESVWGKLRRTSRVGPEEVLTRCDPGQGEDVADLGEEFVPALMREDFPRGPSLHRALIGDRIAE